MYLQLEGIKSGTANRISSYWIDHPALRFEYLTIFSQSILFNLHVNTFCSLDVYQPSNP